MAPVVVSIIIIIIFLLEFPVVSPLFFNLSSIGPGDTNTNIRVVPEAYISEGLQVTPRERNIAMNDRKGWGTYVQSLHLWDKASGRISDFSTHFSFIVNSRGDFNYGDGMAFFLAPVGSQISDSPGGGSFGLPTGKDYLNSSKDHHYVAVEFDTFPNTWDPYKADDRPYTHVGITINSLRSRVADRWYNNITGGREVEASITYNSSTKNLAVDFTGFWINRTVPGRINYTVDLREILPEKVVFGFSASTGSSFEENTVTSWVFNSSLKLDVPTPAPAPEPPVVDVEPIVPPLGGSKPNFGFVGLSIGVILGVVLIILVGCFFWKRRRRNSQEAGEVELVIDPFMDHEFEKGTGPKKFSYSELARATNDFDENQKLGEGGFGSVYKGVLRDPNSYVAVKRVSRGSSQGQKEYASEVRIISKLRHRNLVQLIGWCHEKRELLLVYELMLNGSLDFHLFKGKSLLQWQVRYKITQGVASALLYLHEEWEQCVVHRDIKSSNVMLDSNFNAKLGDFGLARLVDHEKGSQTTMLAGTMGYIAPECVITGRASKESDVFSFGVVALEIACGRKPIDGSFKEGQIRMVEWVWKLYGEGRVLEAADPRLDRDFDEQQMERSMVVGLWCAHPDDKLRPSMRQAIQVLNFEAPMPILPTNMPVPTYFPSAMSMPMQPPYSYSGSSSNGDPGFHNLGYGYNTDTSNFTASTSTTSSVSATAALLRTM